jgi:hypothetical protein
VSKRTRLRNICEDTEAEITEESSEKLDEIDLEFYLDTIGA